MIQLGKHFGGDERGATSEQLQRHRWYIKARQDHQRRELLEDRQESNFTAFAESVVLATEIQIEEFKVRLDAYDEVTVKALMENTQALDLVNAQLDSMLERAYVMEDGRRVFRTEDGTQVFDEFDKEVTRDELDFGLIPSGSPTREQIQELNGKRDQLTTERKQILEFQEKVDSAREKVADGKMTKDDLDALDAELADAVPASVRAHLPEGMNPVANAPDLKTEFASPAARPVIISDSAPDIKPTIVAPAPEPMG